MKHVVILGGGVEFPSDNRKRVVFASAQYAFTRTGDTFFGTPDFAVPTLKALHAAGHEIALVVAQPSRPAGRAGGRADPHLAHDRRAVLLRVSPPTQLELAWLFPQE